jgi:hypothetical protein
MAPAALKHAHVLRDHPGFSRQHGATLLERGKQEVTLAGTQLSVIGEGLSLTGPHLGDAGRGLGVNG